MPLLVSYHFLMMLGLTSRGHVQIVAPCVRNGVIEQGADLRPENSTIFGASLLEILVRVTEDKYEFCTRLRTITGLATGLLCVIQIQKCQNI